ncbi:hypothetical protein, partial [Enterococcus faecium]|uniref:hypothetical protein n=1 Tax=Enterococcus faecium TaxID=1352 RepID=UPI001F1EA34C
YIFFYRCKSAFYHLKFIHNFTFSNYFNFNLIIHDTSVFSHFFAEEKIEVIMQEKNEEAAN